MKGQLPDDQIQSYVNNYKSDGQGGYVLQGQSASAPVSHDPTGLVNFIDNNPISHAAVSLAALPMQLIAKVAGQPDPYANSSMGKSPVLPNGINVTSSDQPTGKFAASELGNAATIGSLAIPGSEIADATGAGLSRFAPQALEGTARVAGRIGAQTAIGAGMGVAGALSGGNTDPGDLWGAAKTGALFGGSLATAGELGSAIVDNFASNSGATRLEAQKNNLKTLQNSFNDTSTKTTNPIQTMTENGLTKDLRVIDGKVNIDNLTNPNQTGSLDNLILDQQKMGTDAVSQMKGGVSTEDFKNSVIDSIKSNPALRASGTVSKIVSEVGRRFDDFSESYGDTIPYQDINSIRIAMNKVWDPETWDAEKAIGDGARSALYNGSGAGTTLQSAMQNEQELINAKTFAQKLMGTAVKGGKLGKYLAEGAGSIVGGMAGAPLPVIGPGLGGLVGGAVTGKGMDLFQKNYFSPLLSGPAQGLQSALSTPAVQGLGRFGKTMLITGATK